MATNRGGDLESQAILALLRGDLHRGLNGRLHRALYRDDFTTAAATVAAVAAAMAAIAAMATMPTVAAARAAVVGRAAVIATVATMMPTTVAAATIRTTAASAATCEQTGLSLVLAADQGNPDQGEEQSNTKNNNAVHPRILQLLTGTVS